MLKKYDYVDEDMLPVTDTLIKQQTSRGASVPSSTKKSLKYTQPISTKANKKSAEERCMILYEKAKLKSEFNKDDCRQKSRS